VVEPVVARKTWRTLEPVHGVVYFAPEPAEEYERAGLAPGRMGYFASRAAPMGTPPAETVIAAFFNFNPALVRDVIPAAWALADPARIIEARMTGIDRTLRRILGDAVASPDVAAAAELARAAAETACERLEGRPLFAGHAALSWPHDPHLVLWHAQTLLREFRGDGHVAALVTHDLSGIEALVTHAANGDVPADVLRATRAWSADDWAAAVDGLRSRDVVDAEGALTEAGRALRQSIEDLTDRLAAPAYARLGDDGCAELRRLVRDTSKQIVAAGDFGVAALRAAAE
jgi:hypothetical protein